MFRPLAALAASLLAACQAAPKPPPAPSPIVTSRTERVLVCPAELGEAPPVRPTPAAGAVVEANEAGAAFLAALGGFADALAARLRDAQSQCPKEPA